MINCSCIPSFIGQLRLPLSKKCNKRLLLLEGVNHYCFLPGRKWNKQLLLIEWLKHAISLPFVTQFYSIDVGILQLKKTAVFFFQNISIGHKYSQQKSRVAFDMNSLTVTLWAARCFMNLPFWSRLTFRYYDSSFKEKE